MDDYKKVQIQDKINKLERNRFRALLHFHTAEYSPVFSKSNMFQSVELWISVSIRTWESDASNVIDEIKLTLMRRAYIYMADFQQPNLLITLNLDFGRHIRHYGRHYCGQEFVLSCESMLVLLGICCSSSSFMELFGAAKYSHRFRNIL